MAGVRAPQFAARTVAKVRLAPVPEALSQRLTSLVLFAQQKGLRVDGLHFAKAFLTPSALSRMEQLVFNDASLELLKGKAARIEFIVEGPIPPELLREASFRRDAIFKQTIAYDLCKGCTLCIQICPKKVYFNDGFGKPDKERNQKEECTGLEQCGKCVTVCPDKAIDVVLADPAFASTVFVLLENPFSQAVAQAEAGRGLYVANPLETGRPLQISGEIIPMDLKASNRVLSESNFHPVFEINGVEQHFVDSANPERALSVWAKENGRGVGLVFSAVRLVYDNLAKVEGLKEGKYSLSAIVNSVIDGVIHSEIEMESEGALELLQGIIKGSYVEEVFFGAKRRPIGGLLPPGTSTAWKTPYGNEVPSYERLGNCVGPECSLCVTNCPEGSGGETAAIKMVPQVPLGTIASLVRGLGVFVLRLDGSHVRTDQVEDLAGTQAFRFEVNEDYCKSCGTCMACCPHGVIDSVAREFNLRGKL